MSGGNGHNSGSHKGHGEPDLEEILQKLSPHTMAEKVTTPHRTAKLKFKLENSEIKDYGEFRDTVAKYVQHHFKEIYGAELPDEYALGQARDILSIEQLGFGSIKAAFRAATEGRMDEVIAALAGYFENQGQRNYINNVVDVYDDLDKQAELVGKVQERIKGILPGVELDKPEYFAQQYSQIISNFANKLYEHGKSMEKVGGHKGGHEPAHAGHK